MRGFDYTRPRDLDEALTLRAEHGPASRLLAGGTDLLLAIEGGGLAPDMLIDLKGISALRTIENGGGAATLGAGVTYTDLIASDLIREKLPAIWESSRLVASVGIRNVATLVGNICNAVPSAESAAPLLVRDAVVSLRSATGAREVAVTEFFTGPRRTVVADDELVTGVRVPYAAEPFGECYLKLGRYRGEDIAQAAVAALVDGSGEWRIAFAAVGPVPLRVPEAEAVLKGSEGTLSDIERAWPAVEKAISPISDIRASKEYRVHMCKVMFEKAVLTAASRRKSGAPAYGERLL